MNRPQVFLLLKYYCIFVANRRQYIAAAEFGLLLVSVFAGSNGATICTQNPAIGVQQPSNGVWVLLGNSSGTGTPPQNISVM
jgi:hypothetical protein